MEEYHIPALLSEAIEALDVQKGKKYIDATLGGGGHAFEILERGGKVLGIDLDQDAIEYVEEKIKKLLALREQKAKIKVGEDIHLVHGNFKDIGQIAHSHGFTGTAGILFDLGVSSHQFDDGERGFSFRSNAPLDMRMDRTLAVTAKDLINGLNKGELYELFTKLGEEQRARAVSDRIVLARKIKPIETTKELAQLMLDVYGGRGVTHRIHPATRVFQALRMAVNGELANLREALPAALEILAPKGRLVVISFHSLEDRIVKQQVRVWESEGRVRILTEKPVSPSVEEIRRNPRVRSAKMRAIEKI